MQRKEDNTEYFEWFNTKKQILNKNGNAENAQQIEFTEAFNIHEVLLRETQKMHWTNISTKLCLSP